MAGGSWDDLPGILRGLFPSFVASAQVGETTAQVWQSLQDASNQWVASTPMVRAAAEAAGYTDTTFWQYALAGVSASDVSVMRGIAGQYVTAHDNLVNTPTDQQILSDAIFRPPWSQSAGQQAITERYRIRVNWNVNVRGFTNIQRNEWVSYELTGPLTTIEDALNQARGYFAAAKYNATAAIQEVLDYSIEAI